MIRYQYVTNADVQLVQLSAHRLPQSLVNDIWNKDTTAHVVCLSQSLLTTVNFIIPASISVIYDSLETDYLRALNLVLNCLDSPADSSSC